MGLDAKLTKCISPSSQFSLVLCLYPSPLSSFPKINQIIKENSKIVSGIIAFLNQISYRQSIQISDLKLEKVTNILWT